MTSPLVQHWHQTNNSDGGYTVRPVKARTAAAKAKRLQTARQAGRGVRARNQRQSWRPALGELATVAVLMAIALALVVIIVI